MPATKICSHSYPPRMAATRPKWCTAERWGIAQAIGHGLNREQAASIGGISKRTLQRWLSSGRDDLDAGRERTNDARFTLLVEQREAQFESRHLRAIQDAGEEGPQYWVCHAWLLERKWPERYAKRDVVKVEGGNTPLVQLNIGDAAVRAVNQRVLGALAELPAGEIVAVEDEPVA